MLKPSDEITITVRRAIPNGKAMVLQHTVVMSAAMIQSYPTPELLIYSEIERLAEGLNEAENREAAYG